MKTLNRQNSKPLILLESDFITQIPFKILKNLGNNCR